MNLLSKLLSVLIFISISVHADEISLPSQIYSSKYMTEMGSFEGNFITLSDQSIWKPATQKDTENLAKVWKNGDKVLVRWNNTLFKYFLHNFTQDPELIDTENTITVVDLKKPSKLKVVAIDDTTVTLSDGSGFSYIPFIGKLHMGERVLVSLNENEKSDVYPYFLVGYTFEKSGKKSEWKIQGEVQAHLLRDK